MLRVFISQPMHGKTDLAYFAKGWETARDCIIEHSCAVAYMVETIIAE